MVLAGFSTASFPAFITRLSIDCSVSEMALFSSLKEATATAVASLEDLPNSLFLFPTSCNSDLRLETPLVNSLVSTLILKEKEEDLFPLSSNFPKPLRASTTLFWRLFTRRVTRSTSSAPVTFTPIVLTDIDFSYSLFSRRCPLHSYGFHRSFRFHHEIQ